MHVSNLHNAHGGEQALIFSSSISKQHGALSSQKGSEYLPVVWCTEERELIRVGAKGLLVGGRSVMSPRMTSDLYKYGPK